MKLDHDRRMKLFESMDRHNIRGKGIIGFSMLVTLENSENPYLKYPVNGVLTINEQGTNLSAIVAIFRILEEDGSLSVPVEVRSHKFVYDGTR